MLQNNKKVYKMIYTNKNAEICSVSPTCISSSNKKSSPAVCSAHLATPNENIATPERVCDVSLDLLLLATNTLKTPSPSISDGETENAAHLCLRLS